MEYVFFFSYGSKCSDSNHVVVDELLYDELGKLYFSHERRERFISIFFQYKITLMH